MNAILFYLEFASPCTYLASLDIEDVGKAAGPDAVASGCFGIPWFFADGEAFFGQDRLPHLAAHLAKPR